MLRRVQDVKKGEGKKRRGSERNMEQRRRRREKRSGFNRRSAQWKCTWS